MNGDLKKRLNIGDWSTKVEPSSLKVRGSQGELSPAERLWLKEQQQAKERAETESIAQSSDSKKWLKQRYVDRKEKIPDHLKATGKVEPDIAGPAFGLGAILTTNFVRKTGIPFVKSNINKFNRWYEKKQSIKEFNELAKTWDLENNKLKKEALEKLSVDLQKIQSFFEANIQKKIANPWDNIHKESSYGTSSHNFIPEVGVNQVDPAKHFTHPLVNSGERKGLNYYTGPGTTINSFYRRADEYLRGKISKGTLEEERRRILERLGISTDDPTMSYLDQIVNKGEVAQPIPLYRIEGSKRGEVDKRIQRMREGDESIDPGYTSTSHSDFIWGGEENRQALTVKFPDKGTTALYNPTSQSEREVILPRLQAWYKSHVSKRNPDLTYFEKNPIKDVNLPPHVVDYTPYTPEEFAKFKEENVRIINNKPSYESGQAEIVDAQFQYTDFDFKQTPFGAAHNPNAATAKDINDVYDYIKGIRKRDPKATFMVFGTDKGAAVARLDKIPTYAEAGLDHPAVDPMYRELINPHNPTYPFRINSKRQMDVIRKPLDIVGENIDFEIMSQVNKLAIKPVNTVLAAKGERLGKPISMLNPYPGTVREMEYQLAQLNPDTRRRILKWAQFGFLAPAMYKALENNK